MAEAAPVLLAGDNPQHDFPETLHGLRSGLPVGVGYPCPLRLRQLPLKIAPFWRQLEEPLSPIVATRLLYNEFLAHQLSEDAAQALLRDAQNCEQLADRHLRVASDKVDDAVMSAAKAVSRENRVRLGGEIAIGKEQQLDPLPHLLFGYGMRVRRQIYVRHVDISRNL